MVVFLLKTITTWLMFDTDVSMNMKSCASRSFAASVLDVPPRSPYHHMCFTVFRMNWPLCCRLPKVSSHVRIHCQSHPLLALQKFASSHAYVSSLRLAKYWLEDCRSNHKGCAMNLMTGLMHTAGEPTHTRPSRLVDIGTAEDNWRVRIVKRSSVPAGSEYLTLSHCWGTKPFFKLTKGNMAECFQSINVSNLSRTFQESLEATRSLGHRYIWIDALCIVQDDEGDWQHEATTMGTIYSNAICNLAAMDSTGGDEGLFRTQNRAGFPNPVIQIDRPAQKSGKYLFLPKGRRQKFVPPTAPLLQRAWVMQERVLSSRTLQFTDDRLRWGCLTCMTDEGQVIWHPIESFEADEFKKSDLISSIQEDEVRKTHVNVQHWWWNIVEEYSKKKLTRESDRLVALSAVAAVIKRIKGWEYVAGLWHETFLDDLLWISRNSYWAQGADWCRQLMTKQIDKSSYSYHAPSWSWASIDASKTNGVYIRRRWVRHPALATPVHTSVVPSPNGDRMGSIIDASLILQCKLFESCFSYADVFNNDRWGSAEVKWDPRAQTLLMNEIFLNEAVPDHTKAANQIFVLPLDGWIGSDTVVRGLFIIKQPERGYEHYSRVGYFNLPDRDSAHKLIRNVPEFWIWYESLTRPQDDRIILV